MQIWNFRFLSLFITISIPYATCILLPKSFAEESLVEATMKTNVESILDRHFPEFRTGILLISHNSLNTSFASHITHKLHKNGPFISTYMQFSDKLISTNTVFGKLMPYIVLLTDKDVHIFDDILANLTNTKIWDPRSHFIIVLDSTNTSPGSSSRNILHLCWKHDILNAIVLQFTQDSSKNAELQIFSYNPFPPDHNFMNLTSAWQRKKPLFANKLLNLYGFPLRGSIYHFPPHSMETILPNGQKDYNGYDGRMMKTLCQHLNATVKFMSPLDGYTFGVLLKNGTITGSSGDIAYRRAELALNSRFMKPDWAYAVLPTYTHIKTDFCLLVPKAKFIPRYMNLILPFTVSLWTPVILSLPFATLAWFFILKLSGRWKTDSVTWIDLSLQTYGSFLLSSFKTLPDSDPERAYLVFWVMYSMVVNNAYQGSMTSFLAVPRFLKDIDTLEQLDKSGYGVYAYPGSETYVKRDENNPVMTSLMRKFTESDASFYKMSEKIIASDRMAGMCDYNAARYFVSLPRYHRAGFPQLHLMQECLVPGPHVYETPRDSPFLYRFSDIIQHMVQAGLFDLWLEWTLVKAVLEENWDSDADTSKPRALQPEHLQSAFFLLVLGVVGSIATFVGEHYTAWRQAKRMGKPMGQLMGQPMDQPKGQRVERFGKLYR